MSPMPTSLQFRLKNDDYIEWGPMYDGTTGITTGDGVAVPIVYLNALTGTATLVDSTGAVVTGFSALAFTYVAGSNGIYRCLVEESFAPPYGWYTLQIDFKAAGGDPEYYREMPLKVVP